MGRGRGHSSIARAVAVGCALTLMASGCGSDGQPDAAPARTACGSSSGTTEPRTATGTIPFEAPPRSFKPVFKGEELEVEKAFRARVDAVNRQDYDAILELDGMTPELNPHPSKKDQKDVEDMADFVAHYRVVLYRINAIHVSGDQATVDYEDSIVPRTLESDITTLLAQHDVWRKKSFGWTSESDVSSAPGIPDDLATVNVSMRPGHRMEIMTPIPDGEFAFSLTNGGPVTAAPRGLFILGVPPDTDVPTLMTRLNRVFDEGEKMDLGPGYRDMGATPEIAPCSKGTMVFNGRLPEGRYLILARTGTDFEKQELQPKEYADFTVS